MNTGWGPDIMKRSPLQAIEALIKWDENMNIRFQRLLVKRPLPLSFHSDDLGGHLKKVLNPLDLIMIGLGASIGTGIFVITGLASSIAGPGIVLSFIIASICSLFVALCYAELSSMIPLTGSAYSYTYTIFGELFAWIIGWTMMLELTVSISLIASGWSQYLLGIFDALHVPLNSALTRDPMNGGLVNLPAVIIILCMAFMLLQGVRESSRLNAVLVSIKLLILITFFWIGSQIINVENYFPVLPNGFQGVLTGAGLVIVAFTGFELIASSAEEVKNPQRNLPIGLIGTIVICSFFYIIAGLVLTGILPFSQYANVGSPFEFALSQSGFSHLGGLLAVGIIIGITSGLQVCLYGSSRLVYALSRDGLIPSGLATVSAKGIPFKATILVGLMSAVFAGFAPLSLIVELLNMGTLIAFIAVAAGVLFMRHKNPDLERPFRCPMVPLVPILAIISDLFLIVSLRTTTLFYFCIWLVIGLMVYGLYGIRQSELVKKVKIDLPYPGTVEIPVAQIQEAV